MKDGKITCQFKDRPGVAERAVVQYNAFLDRKKSRGKSSRDRKRRNKEVDFDQLSEKQQEKMCK